MSESLIEIQEIIQKPNFLQSTFNFASESGTKFSENIVIDYSIVFKVKARAWRENNSSPLRNCLFVQFVNKQTICKNEFHEVIQFSSEKLNIKNWQFNSNDDDNIWHLIKEDYFSSFDVTICLGSPLKYSLAFLYEMKNREDFELVGGGGSVKVHRLILAAASPVLRRMLSTTWKETEEGLIELKGVSKETLQHFKEYIYKQLLPETGIESLMVLAAYYEMAKLEQACVNKMMCNVTNNNLYELLEFALIHKAYRLLFSLLHSLNSDTNKINTLIDIIKNNYGRAVTFT